jgi:hypothetical protein
MEKDKKKKIDVENPTGRPLDFPFDCRKGKLAAASMVSDVPRDSHFKNVEDA